MSTVHRRFASIALMALFVFALSSNASAQTLGYAGLESNALTALSQQSPSDALEVPGFDPIQDVPAMKNWKGPFEVKGAGCCYAASVLTYHFFHKVCFTGEAGVSAEEWRDADDDAKPVLRIEGEEALDLLGEYLSKKNPKPIRVGPARSLRDFTTAGTPGEEMFKNWAEAIQYHLQVKNDGLRYAGSILRSRLGFLPGCGRDDVIRNGLGIIRDRLRDGKLVPTVFHPDGLQFQGHVMVVYKMSETEDEATLTLYDVNTPPTDDEARPTVITVNKNSGDYEAVRYDGRVTYDYKLFSVLKPDGFMGRRSFRKIVTNYQESLERNAHLGRVVSDGNSLLDRIGGVAGFVAEHINPF